MSIVMQRILLSLIVVLVISSGTALSQNIPGCGKDTDCKGERICVRGECVDPVQAKPLLSKPTAAVGVPSRFASVAIVPMTCTRCSPGPQDWETYPHGNVKVVTSNGGSILLTHDGQARLPALSPDGSLVGWVTGSHGIAEHGETVLLSTDLVLWREEKKSRIHRDGFIHRWSFCDGGAHVALATGPVRDVRFYSLYDARSGKLLESHDWSDYEGKQKPAWMRTVSRE